MIPTQRLLNVVPHPVTHLVVHDDGGKECSTVASQIIGHGKGAGNLITGVTAHTHIVIVQIPHHH